MRRHKRKKQKSSNSQINIQPQLQTRPFTAQSQATNQVADLQTFQETTQQPERSFTDVPIFTPERSPKSIPIQPKLTIGAPGDKYEQEADRVAHEVVNQINTPTANNLQRETTAEEEEEVQTKLENNASFPLINRLMLKPDRGEMGQEAMFPAENKLNTYLNRQKNFDLNTLQFKKSQSSVSASSSKKIIQRELDPQYDQAWLSGAVSAENQTKFQNFYTQVLELLGSYRDLSDMSDANTQLEIIAPLANKLDQWLAQIEDDLMYGDYEQLQNRVEELYKQVKIEKQELDDLIQQQEEKEQELQQNVKVDAPATESDSTDADDAKNADDSEFIDAPLQDNSNLKYGILPQGSLIKVPNKDLPAFPCQANFNVYFSEHKEDGKCLVTISGQKAQFIVNYADINFNPEGAYQKTDLPLFPPAHSVSSQDVQQERLGDCYLQAALASIADQNPGHIKNMMRDNGDTVTVRLFEVNKDESDNPQFTAKFIKVEKSIPRRQNQYNQGALWVHMAQKAYVAGGFLGKPENQPISDTTKSYADIVGGFSTHAFEVILGQQADTIPLSSQSTSGHFGLTKSMHGPAMFSPWGAGIIAAYDSDSDNPPDILNKVFNSEAEKISQWVAFVKAEGIEDKITTLLNAESRGKSNSKAGETTLADIRAIFAGHNFTQDIMQWIDNQNIFPGDLGTANYTKFQQETFDSILKCLQDGKPAAIATHTTIHEEGVDSGVSGQEKVYGGLAGNHAYSILEAKTTENNNPEGNPGDRFYWLKIFNPWRKNAYARKHGAKERPLPGLIPIDDDRGLFWIELSKLTKYFTNVSLGVEPKDEFADIPDLDIPLPDFE